VQTSTQSNQYFGSNSVITYQGANSIQDVDRNSHPTQGMTSHSWYLGVSIQKMIVATHMRGMSEDDDSSDSIGGNRQSNGKITQC
jgi:hypothetical protein